MNPLNFRQLEDRARDVDPDLRYMALEDFQKHLNGPKTTQLRSVWAFVPLLFNLLADSATEVQNQAVRSFAPLVRHSSDAETAEIVEKLFHAIESTANDSKFSTSVPTLALRSIFTESAAHFGPALSRTILDALLPRIFAPGAMNIDKIEVFIDMARALGRTFALSELLSIVAALIGGAFRENGIIGKRSIIAVDACLPYALNASQDQHAQVLQFFDKVVADVIDLARNCPASLHTTNVLYTLLQVVLAQASETQAISEASLRVVFQEIMTGLRLDSLTEAVDTEDWDIDELIQTNIVRENALITLSGLVSCFTSDAFMCTYASPIFDIVEKFIAYDPLLSQDSGNEDDSGADSEFEFSDDEEIEQFENTGENDVLAAKLRLLALVIIKKVIHEIPFALLALLKELIPGMVVSALGDRSEIVSNEAIITLVAFLRTAATSKRYVRSRAGSDVSMATESAESTPFSIVSKEHIESIEQMVFSTLLSVKNIARFSNTKILIETLVSNYADELEGSFLENLTQAFVTLKLSLQTYPEIVKTYKVLLSFYEFDQIPLALIDYIAEDLGVALSEPSTYHNAVAETLQVCGLLYRTVPRSEKYTEMMNEKFFSAIAQNLQKREYAGDTRQHLLASLADLIIHIDLTPASRQESVRVFEKSLNHEVSVNFTIETMAKVFEQKPTAVDCPELCEVTMKKLMGYLSSSDTSLYMCSFSLLIAMFENTSFVGSSESILRLRDVIFGLMRSSVDSDLIGKGFLLLGLIVKIIPLDKALYELLITLIINTNYTEVDDIDMKPFETMVRQIAHHNTMGSEMLFSIGINCLSLKNFISAKMMALVCDSCKMGDKVDEIERTLLQYMQNPSPQVSADRVVFNIHFLGCMSTVGELKNFTFQEFFEIPKRETNDQICLAAARAMGLCTVRNLDTSLPILLKYYDEASRESASRASLYLIALKQLSREGAWTNGEGALRLIWDTLLTVVSAKEGKLTHKDVLELKLVGDVLSSITEADQEGDYQRKILMIINEFDSNANNEYIIYTVVVIMKQLVGKSTGDFEVQIIELIMSYLTIPDLELKLAIISTLLTGIYNRSLAFAGILDSVVLPAIYEELTAKAEFKKTIPMGPYKYVVDEGLEVRKLSYELISAIISLNSSKTQAVPFAVDEVKVFEVLLEKGLKDQESEIINLTVYNLIQIIQKDDTVLCKIRSQLEMITSLLKLLNRKLRSKASTQETESYEDTLRAVIKLSKVINGAFAANNALTNEWSTFYQELKTKHHLLFSAVDL
ncbi:cullin-associated NEDD8-dissociated protein 1 [Metschnikowia aff. pulcherrima]|uniref:Cullin-associated NEDD8-dissociated protein 1 n=2 Tax=Metschnikowia TaxID=27320 RepID=A0A4P6XNE4_9ASCO|nr:cullin-associated NEDD8-dissociated protein 1 [Metschnikowia aff. pulcherrima]